MFELELLGGRMGNLRAKAMVMRDISLQLHKYRISWVYLNIQAHILCVGVVFFTLSSLSSFSI